MTGAGTSATQIGRADLGVATLSEMVTNASNITATVDVPVIADADTGYGGILNVQRTVQLYERAGVAAIHIEDQDFPKRCGHLEDKKVIGAGNMVQKIRAAVEARTDDDFVIIVRTDALAVTGMEDTLARCEKYVGRCGCAVRRGPPIASGGGAGSPVLRCTFALQLRRIGQIATDPGTRAGANGVQNCYLPQQRHPDCVQGSYRGYAGAQDPRHD